MIARLEPWTGDVYKVIETLRRGRPDLVVLLINTAPTGTAVVVGVDQASTILKTTTQPKSTICCNPTRRRRPRSIWTAPLQPSRTSACVPVWEQLLAVRESASSAELGGLWDELRSLWPAEGPDRFVELLGPGPTVADG